MQSGNRFPWEALKANSLREVCHQICATTEQKFSKSLVNRDEMIAFLRDVDARGLDAAVKTLGKAKRPQRARTDQASSSVKRKKADEDVDDDDEDEDPTAVAQTEEPPTTPSSLQHPLSQAYNTRFKGVKRVKLGREVPDSFLYTTHQRRARASRKTSRAKLRSPSASITDENSVSVSAKDSAPKRSRGRPRKQPAPPEVGEPVTPSKAGRPPNSATKQVFDGVVVMKRPYSPRKTDEVPGVSASHHDPDADAEGDMDGEAEDVPCHHEEGDMDGKAEEVPSHHEEGDMDGEAEEVPSHHEQATNLNGSSGVGSENEHVDSQGSQQGDPSVAP